MRILLLLTVLASPCLGFSAGGGGAPWGARFNSLSRRAASSRSGAAGLLALSGGAPSKSALCLLAEGFEELEAVAPIDILRRAEVKVTLASLTSNLAVKGRNGITVQADTDLDSALKDSALYDCVLVPGGPPAVPSVGTLKNDPRVLSLLKDQKGSGRLVSAICAAPSVLKEAGVLDGGVKYTAHFSVKDVVPEIDSSRAVVVDGNVLTSQGAGTAVEFGLGLVEYLIDKKTADDIAKSICFKP